MKREALPEMHNMGVVVENLDKAIDFFVALGLTLEGRMMVEGEWAGRVTGLGNQSVEIAMMVTPDGHGRLELSRFLRPAPIADQRGHELIHVDIMNRATGEVLDHRAAPVNALGYLRVMFRVSDIDATLDGLRAHGAELVGEVMQYENIYRLCYIRGPEGLLIGLGQQLGDKTTADIVKQS